MKNLNSNENPKTKNYQFKIVLSGDSTVGKTSLLTRFIEGKFCEFNKCTICDDFKTILIKIDQTTTAKLTIWDTAGQEKYRALTRNYFKDAHGIVLLYDVTNKSSFISLNKWLDDINENILRENVSIILVGNKIDLPNRVISYDEGDDFAKKNNLLYCETSTKEGNNIDDVFEMIANNIIENKNSYGDSNDVSLTESVKAVRGSRLPSKYQINCC